MPPSLLDDGFAVRCLFSVNVSLRARKKARPASAGRCRLLLTRQLGPSGFILSHMQSGMENNAARILAKDQKSVLHS